MSTTTIFSPAALTIGQKVSLVTSVTCPVTATASAPTEVVSKPLDFTGAIPLVSQPVITDRLLFWAPAVLLSEAGKRPQLAGRHVEMAGEVAGPCDEEMERRNAIGILEFFEVSRWE
jgi:hypothetical protein